MNCYKTISAIAFAGLLTFFHTELYAQQSLADTIIHLLRKSHINNKLDSASFNTAREHILTADLTDEQIAQIESAAGGLSEPENHEIRFVIFTNLLNNDADRTISYGQLQIEKFDKLNSPEASNLKFLYLARLRFPFRNTNRLEEGLQYYLRKLNDYLTSNDSLAISQCHFVLGGFYSVSGIIDLAIYHCKKAISYVDTSKRKWTRINHVAVLGSEYLRKGDKTACLQYSGIAYREFLKSKSGYSFSALNIARMMLSSNESDSAAYYIKKAKEDPAVARSYADQCSILQTEALFKIRSGYLDEAEALLNKCWQLIFENNIIVGPGAGVIAPDYYLALVKIEQNKLDEAIVLLTKDIKRLKNYRVDVIRDYKLMAELYKKAGKNDKAAETYAIFIAKQDSLLADQAKYRFISFEAEQLISEKELSIAKLESQNRISYLFRNFLIAIATLLFLLAVGLYNRFQYKKKANKVLETTLISLESTQTQLMQLEKAEALRLKELDEVKTKLYTNITHEFRTPLTVILGMAQQVIEHPKLNLRAGLNMIIRNGQNLLTLVNQMLDLSKLENGKLTLHYQRGDMVPFLAYIVESHHSLAQNKGIQLHFTPKVEQIIMDFDEVRLQQIVSNILSNAIKFTPEGGDVYVSSDIENNKLILKIKDTGIGITEADLPRVFDRFYQSDGKHTRRGEGTGIGLTLTRELVNIMDGTISVHSEKGNGTEFEVNFPLLQISKPDETTQKTALLTTKPISEAAAEQVEDLLPVLTAQVDEDKSKRIDRPHILIADDNDDVRAYLTACLDNHYNIDISKHGQECENLALNNIPDLIILDVMMPFKDGFEVCKALKSDERTSHIPIIMLSAKADLGSRLDGLEQKADDYLTKPFNKKELLLRIRNLLELRRQLQQYYISTFKASPIHDNAPTAENPLPSSGSLFKGVEKSYGNPSIPLVTSLENAFVIKVRKAIETHLDSPGFDVDKLCRNLAMSHSQVHRKLIALTGLSATHFIRYVRLAKAKEMIKSSGYSIAAIAMDCGFNDPAYFSRVFKQEFGSTPQGWREANS